MSASSSGNIHLSFGWQGIISGPDGSSIEKIELDFEDDIGADITASIPLTILPEKYHTYSHLAFTFTPRGTNASPSFPSRLLIPVNLLRGLNLFAQVYKPSTSSTLMVSDPSGRTARAETVTSVKKNITFVLPAIIEAGKRYRLWVRSDFELSLNAVLLPEEEADASITSAKTATQTEMANLEKVSEFIAIHLLTALRVQAVSLIALLSLQPPGNKPMLVMSTEPIPEEVTLVVQYIYKLAKTTIAELAADITKLEKTVNTTGSMLSENSAMASVVIQKVIQAMENMLPDMMRTYIQMITKPAETATTSTSSSSSSSSSSISCSSTSSTPSYSSKVRELIEKCVVDFQKLCLAAFCAKSPSPPSWKYC